MQQHEADSEESFLGLGMIPNNEKTWFDFESTVPELDEIYSNELLVSAQLRLSRDVKHHNRSIYTSLDLLGDVGGLFDALKGIMSFIIAIYFKVFGDPVQEYLLNAMFLKNKSSHAKVKRKRYMPNQEKMKLLSKRSSYEIPRVLCTCLRS